MIALRAVDDDVVLVVLAVRSHDSDLISLGRANDCCAGVAAETRRRIRPLLLPQVQVGSKIEL
jgi:hypothetical protein